MSIAIPSRHPLSVLFREPNLLDPERKPTGSIVLDQQSGVDAAWPFYERVGGTTKEVATDTDYSIFAGSSLNNDGLSIDSETGNGFSYANLTGGSYALILDVIHPTRATPGTQNGYAFDAGTAAPNRLIFAMWQSSGAGPSIYDGSAWQLSLGSEIIDGRRHTWGFVTRGSSCEIWLDGDLMGSAGCSVGNLSTVQIIGDNNSATNSPTGYTIKGMHFFSSSPPSAPEMSKLTKDFWSAYHPVNDAPFLYATAGSNDEYYKTLLSGNSL